METSQFVSEDEYSSETQTTTSASKNQVEPEITSEQKNPPVTKKLEQLPRESEFLNRHRKKTRLCDPKGVYEFRHIEPRWYQSFLQLITMLMSLSSMVGLYYVGYQESKESLVGIGEVSTLTWIDAIQVISIIAIIFMAIKNLGKQLKVHPQKSYRLAILANSFNLMWLNNFRLLLALALLFFAMIGMQEQSYESFDLEFLVEGAAADLFDAILSFFIVIICLRSFRFCGKELAE
ncbi:hypothetical protein [Moritella yayanosii]|uniref:Uncharacterized protein n=1 Tax=Moritella yayanosii TaxID=69539 RepID=A0A330LJ42_9GAMM|nr:hypothetical protein [Moritella yayanosii]SQD76693.1 conserved membrane protein of unknown function [Moritella yayanosii]